MTHPFKPLPEKVEVSAGSSRTLVALGLFEGEPTDVLAYLEKKKGANEAFDFSEKWLRAHPEDEIMLRAYSDAARRAKQSSHFDAFVRSGLTNRPVLIAWHRTYQTQHDRGPERAELLSQYDELLRNDPANSALLYLRGRLETNRTMARDYFTRSAEADPRNPFPSYALGFDRMTAGDWQGAKPFFSHAVELEPRDLSFGGLLFQTRLALKEAPALEQEMRKKLGSDPMDYLTQLKLIEALAAQEQPDKAIAAANNFTALCKSRYGANGDNLARVISYHAYYAAADFDRLRSASAIDQSPSGRINTAMALIEKGQPDAAAKALPPEMDSDDEEMLCLALAITYHQNGNEVAAAQWSSRAANLLEHGNSDDMQAAALLKRGTAPPRAELENIALLPALKAAIVTELAMEYPHSRAELLAFARELNIERGFPYHLVQRVAAKGPQ